MAILKRSDEQSPAGFAESGTLQAQGRCREVHPLPLIALGFLRSSEQKKLNKTRKDRRGPSVQQGNRWCLKAASALDRCSVGARATRGVSAVTKQRREIKESRYPKVSLNVAMVREISYPLECLDAVMGHAHGGCGSTETCFTVLPRFDQFFELLPRFATRCNIILCIVVVTYRVCISRSLPESCT